MLMRYVNLSMVLQGLDIIGVQTVINYECPRDLTRQVFA